MIAALLLTACVIAAPIELHAIPVDVSRAVCFIAAADNDGTADLFVLDGRLLAIYEDAAAVAPRVVELPDGAAALDIADLEDDGQFEAIVLAGDDVYRVDLSGLATGGPVALFQRQTQFSTFARTPKLHVLVTAWNGEICLALPTEDALELCRPDGTVLASLPMGLDAPHSALYGQPFRYVPVDPPLAGAPDSLEFRVNRMLAFKPQLPAELAGAEGPEAPPFNTVRRARDAEQLPPDRWPWFPLRTGEEPGDRVAFALSAGPPQETWTRIRPLAITPSEADTGDAFGPLRRYPGSLIVVQADPPDFNGDGYHDLLLWHAPNPTPSISAISRITVRGTWPITLTAHRFIPEKQRFEPKPWCAIPMDAPVDWFLAAGNQIPLRHLVWRDINGDGKADFACATGSQTYGIWLAGEKGFSRTPDFHTELPEPILGIAFQAALEGQRATSIGLRGTTRLFVLKPAKNSAAVPPSTPANPVPAASTETVSNPIPADPILEPSL